jgi:hypothetical protein
VLGLGLFRGSLLLYHMGRSTVDMHTNEIHVLKELY